MAQTLQKIYSDIDFNFTRTPGRNDVAVSYDEMAVIRSVRNLLLTRNYERPFQPELGSNIRRLLFEPIDSIVASSLERQLQETIENFEPRVSLELVDVKSLPDYNSYQVTITFYIENLVQPFTADFILSRLR